jgi:hypothetical protein
LFKIEKKKNWNTLIERQILPTLRNSLNVVVGSGSTSISHMMRSLLPNSAHTILISYVSRFICLLSSPTLLLHIAFIIQSYGLVLNPWAPGDPAYEPRNVSRTLSSVVGVACLRTEERVGPQLTSHVFGLRKSHVDSYNGEPVTEGDRWLSSEEGTEWVIKTIDELGDVVRGVDEHAQAKL